VARTPDAQMLRNKGHQPSVIAKGAEGQLLLPLGTESLIMPLHRAKRANATASVCLYSTQERSLFTATLEQTSVVPSRIASCYA